MKHAAVTAMSPFLLRSRGCTAGPEAATGGAQARTPQVTICGPVRVGYVDYLLVWVASPATWHDAGPRRALRLCYVDNRLPANHSACSRTAPDRARRYVTIVRDPVQRVLSEFYWGQPHCESSETSTRWWGDWGAALCADWKAREREIGPGRLCMGRLLACVSAIPVTTACCGGSVTSMGPLFCLRKPTLSQTATTRRADWRAGCVLPTTSPTTA